MIDIELLKSHKGHFERFVELAKAIKSYGKGLLIVIYDEKLTNQWIDHTSN